MILSVSIILMIILQFVVHKTKIGKAMRAVSFDSEAAKLMGINVNHTISATFAIGSALAGAAGVIFGIYYIKIEPLMGVLPGLKAFVAAVLGGIGIIPGAMVGGLLLGVIEALVSAAGYSLWRDGVAFIVLILILIFLPQGYSVKIKEKKYRGDMAMTTLKNSKGFWLSIVFALIFFRNHAVYHFKRYPQSILYQHAHVYRHQYHAGDEPSFNHRNHRTVLDRTCRVFSGRGLCFGSDDNEA